MSSPSSRHRNNGIRFFTNEGVFLTYRDWKSGVFNNANTHIHKKRELISGQFPPEIIPSIDEFYSPTTGGYWFNGNTAISWNYNDGLPYLFKNGQRLLVDLPYLLYIIISACVDTDGNTIVVVIKSDVLVDNNYDLLLIKYDKFTNNELYSRVFYSFNSIYEVAYLLGNKSSFLSDCQTFIFINTDSVQVIDNNAIFFKFSDDYSANEFHLLNITSCNALFYAKEYVTLEVFDNATAELSTIRITANGEESIINRYPPLAGDPLEGHLILWIDDDNELSFKAVYSEPALGTLYFNGNELLSGEFVSSESSNALTSRIPQSAFDGTLLTADFAIGHGGNIMINVKTGQMRIINYPLTGNGVYFPLTVSEYKVL